jgi:cell wall-associated NlpC family hydrolase
MDNFHIEAYKYIGVKFRHRGRTRRGMDCVGLVIAAAEDCGYDRYEEFPYGREPRNAVLQSVLKQHFGKPVHREPQVNDVILLKLKPNGPPSHVGIVTTHPNGLGIIHSYGTIGKVTYQGLTDKMKDLIVGVYQWQERY